MPSSGSKPEVQLEDIVEVLAAYASAVADKDIAILSSRMISTGLSEGNYIRLPESVESSREDAISMLKVRVTLEASMLKYAGETVDPKAIPKYYRDVLGHKHHSLDLSALRLVMPPRSWAGFTCLLKVLELGRVRQRVRTEYPLLDRKIDDFVKDFLFKIDDRHNLRDDLRRWPDSLISEVKGRFGKTEDILTYEERENELTCKELAYILLLSGEKDVRKELSSMTEKLRRIYKTVFPKLRRKRATKSDSVRLAFRLLDREFDKDRHKNRKTDDLERKVEADREQYHRRRHDGQAYHEGFPRVLVRSAEFSENSDNLSSAIRFVNSDKSPVEGSPRFKLDEWDSDSRSYIRDACTVRESSLSSPSAAGISPLNFVFSEREVAEISEVLESLKPEGKVTSRKLRSGEVDFNEWVKYKMQKSTGIDAEERFYRRTERRERDVAQLILWDISNSTLGYCSNAALNAGMRIIDMEMYGLLHYAAAVRDLGDDLAIFAYNSNGRDGVYVYPVLRFGSSMSIEELRSIITAVKPHAQNHDGAALRHVLNNYLSYHTAQTRIMVHINDGVPEDKTFSAQNVLSGVYSRDKLAEYAGEYAINDVKKALEEYASQGVITFGLSFAQEAARPTLERIWGDQYKMLKTPYSLGKKLAQVMLEKTLV
jgi:hypothetical protein